MKNLRTLLGRLGKYSLPPSYNHSWIERPRIRWSYDLLALFMLALFVRGVVLHLGAVALPFGDRLEAAPVASLWLA